MKTKFRMICLILSMLLLLGACSSGGGTTQPETTQTDATQTTEADILTQRRNLVEAHMRAQMSVLWRSTEDIEYIKTAGGEATVNIVKGRLYRGLPYTQAAAGTSAFLEYAVSTDSNGIHTISGLPAEALGGNSTDCRISVDCSSAVWLAWNQVATSMSDAKTGTKNMVSSNGYIRVGDYQSDDTVNDNTKNTCASNGNTTMSAAYALLQKGDAVVHNNSGAGHIMMIVENHVVERNGKISAVQSYVTVMDQTSVNHRAEEKYYDETLKEDVYYIGNIDKKVSYQELFQSGYLPITVKELVDPTPVDEEKVTDSITTPTKDNIFEGTFTNTRAFESVTITITDANGKEVQKATCFKKRSGLRTFDLQTFVTEIPEHMLGSVDLSKLAAGTYHCTHTVRTAIGNEVKMRDFEFTV